MSSNALTLLQQLSENPDMITQLQSVLSMLQPQSQQTSRPQHPNQANHTSNSQHYASHHKPAGNAIGTPLSSGTVTLVGNSSGGSSSDNSQNTTSSAASPALTLADNGHLGRSHASTQPHQQQQQQQQQQMAELQRLYQQSAARGRQLEKEVAQMTHRVEQLIAVVKDQKQQIQDAADRHALEIASLKHVHEAAMRKKDEIHEAALAQVVKAQQLRQTAHRFEQRSQALRHTPVNTAPTSVASAQSLKEHQEQFRRRYNHSGSSNSGMKRPRREEEEEEGGAAQDLWKERSELLTGRDDTATLASLRSGRHWPQQASTPVSAPTGKSSAAGASASARKRHTPRTPSATYADRIHSRSPVPTTTPAAGNRAGAAQPAAARAPPPSGVTAELSPASRFVKTYESGRDLPPAMPPLPAPPAAGQHHSARRQVPSGRSGTSSVVSGPTRSPSPTNPKRGPPVPRRFVFTGLQDAEMAELRAAIQTVGEEAAALASEFDEAPPHQTTHIVCRGTPRSVKALCGLVNGKWLVPPEYITNSRDAGFWLDEADEGCLRIFPPPLKCQRFLLTVAQPGIRQRLAEVIQHGGGEIVDSHGAHGAVTAEDVIVINSGDDLLRYATQPPEQ